jgi:hypothetical protein
MNCQEIHARHEEGLGLLAASNWLGSTALGWADGPEILTGVPFRGVHERHTAAAIASTSGGRLCPWHELHATLGGAGSYRGRRTMRALGVLFILLGLALAAFAVRTAGSDGAAVADSRPAGASSASAIASVSQVVYVAPARPASAPTVPAALGSAGAAKNGLVSELQRELTRIGCYGGEINGIWTRSTRRAMGALIQRVNARLPTAQPEPVHLALAQGQHGRICAECPTGEESKSDARCANRTVVAMFAAAVAPVRSPERISGGAGKRWQMPQPTDWTTDPTQGRMGLGVSGRSIEAAVPGARRRSADQGSRTHQRAGRRHRTFVAHKPPRHSRPMHYAYHRHWGGFFAALFEW